jgi:ketosteroid isomerase-like protein
VRLAGAPDGPALGIKWFPPGQPTDVHGHSGWGAFLVLEGTDRYERWHPTTSGATALGDVRILTAGEAHWFPGPPHDIHRQEGVGTGALELIVLGSPGRPLPRHPITEADMSANALINRITTALHRYDWAALTREYRADAVLEVNSPRWRFQRAGPAAAAEYARTELAGLERLRVVSWRTVPTGDGVVIEVEIRYGGPDGEYLRREIHLVVTDAQSIIEHRVYCTGIWDPAVIARQRAEAPMVRP